MREQSEFIHTSLKGTEQRGFWSGCDVENCVGEKYCVEEKCDLCGDSVFIPPP